jgi:hypothetical protein
MAVVSLVVGDALANSAQAHSGQENGQWRAYFSGGPTNCSLATFEDCLQTIKGKPGLCIQNAQSVPPPESNAALLEITLVHPGYSLASGARRFAIQPLV